MADTISKLLAKVESLEAEAKAHSKTTANIPLSLAEIAKEVKQQDDKKYTVVVEFAAEGQDEATNNATDRTLAEQLVTSAGLDTSAIQKVWRHTGSSWKAGQRRPRPLKINLAEPNKAHDVIKALRAAKNWSWLPPKAHVRRDLTRAEQTQLHEARRKCHTLNTAANASKYFVDDLFDVKEKKSPRPWSTAQVSASA
ncbi:unnamed protein product [Bursaphelenchus xylophilus]|nr:unnamed protein product [Bursaphelenchus xylophilus]CAG9097980.1 unnamed protein product [Bursaphelenchus xylophilus]